jgi:hypothetical protein
MLLMGSLFSAFAWADVPHASITYVKKVHQKGQKHHAHPATKHKAPKHHNTV